MANNPFVKHADHPLSPLQRARTASQSGNYIQDAVTRADMLERQTLEALGTTLFDSVNRSPTNAQLLVQRFSAEDKEIIQQVISNTVTFLPENYISKIREIFNQLDVTGDGYLGQDDFVSTNPTANTFLKHVWLQIMSRFDFDGDGKVDFNEFLGYFVVFALYQVPMEAIPAANSMIVQFATWRNNFLNVIYEKVTRFEAALH